MYLASTVCMIFFYLVCNILRTRSTGRGYFELAAAITRSRVRRTAGTTIYFDLNSDVVLVWRRRLGRATGSGETPNAFARVGFPQTTEPAHRPDVVWGPRLEMLLVAACEPV